MATRTRKTTEHKELVVMDAPVNSVEIEKSTEPAFAPEIAGMLATTDDLDGILADLQRELCELKFEYMVQLAAGKNPVRIGHEMEAKAREISAVLMRSVTYYTHSIPALLA